MGLSMSFMGLGGGLPSGRMLNFLMATLYDQFIKKDIQNFEEFQFAILDIFNTFNSSLPGKHYEVPLRKEIEDMFIRWENAKVQDRRNIFIQFMKDNVRLSKVDNATVITGVVTPPVAMAAKRAGESVPQLKMIKAIPDVFFVPSATVLALISVKISRRIFTAKKASSTHSEPDIQMKTETIGEARAPETIGEARAPETIGEARAPETIGEARAPQGGAPAPLVIGNSHEEREIHPSNLHRTPSVIGTSHGEQEIRPSNPNRRWCLTKCQNEDCIYCARPCIFES